MHSEKMTKSELRIQIREKIKLHKEELLVRSERICEKIIESDFYKNAGLVLAYMALPDEVNLWKVIEKAWEDGKKVYVPKIVPGTNKMDFYQIERGNLLESGSFGIAEPSETWNKFEILKYDFKIAGLIPGRAFGKNGERLGRGKGFYDTFLFELKSKNPENFIMAGIGFDFQKMDAVPVEAHDIKMDVVVSD